MARRKPNLKNPNSMTWRKKTDNMWAAVIKQVGFCEYCNHEDRQLNAHHIIARVRLRFRHDVSNGICLCVTCHSFDTDISPHQKLITLKGKRFQKASDRNRVNKLGSDSFSLSRDAFQ